MEIGSGIRRLGDGRVNVYLLEEAGAVTIVGAGGPGYWRDGATRDVPGTPRVIHAPGHTAGSAALHVPSRNAIFVGDAFVTRNVITGSTGPQLFPNFNADNRQAYASLARLYRVDARLVLPGHGEAWTGGLAEAIGQVRASSDPAWRS